jgi:hypothetical protein
MESVHAWLAKAGAETQGTAVLGAAWGPTSLYVISELCMRSRDMPRSFALPCSSRKQLLPAAGWNFSWYIPDSKLKWLLF